MPAYTNRPELENQIIPGSNDKWQYVPTPEGGVDWTPDMAKGNISNEQIQEIQGDFNTKVAPPEPLLGIESRIPRDRKAFKQAVIEQMGKDPEKINVPQVALEDLKVNLKPLWEHVFGKNTPYMGRLMPDQAKLWEQAKDQYYTNKYNVLLAQNRIDRETLDNALSEFDRDTKMQQEAGKSPFENVSDNELLAMSLDEKSPNSEMAQKILDKKEQMKITGAEEQQKIKQGEIDIPGLAKAVANGQDSTIAIKGSMGNPVSTKVKSEVLKLYPKFDFNMADANYKWKQSATNQRTINFVGGALPRLAALDEQVKMLPNVNFNTVNKVMSAISKEMGKPAYTNFEANRNAIVQEINTALSGTSQASDLRIKIELDNLKSSRSPEQLKGAISNLRMALEARLDVDLSPLYPIEVVRGEKSLAQYKKDLYKQYQGKYMVNNVDNKQVVERRKSKSGKTLVKYSDGTIGEE